MFRCNWIIKAVLIVISGVGSCPAAALAARDPTAVPTFHCIGSYWNPEDGSSVNVCQVRYCRADSSEWKKAPL
jgi:hypothetical protein